MSDFKNIDALQAYLDLAARNKSLSETNHILNEELQKYRKEYARISQGIVDLNLWLATRDGTTTIRRKMAAIFKFAYLEYQFKEEVK